MQEITVTPLEALYRLIGAASMIDSAECKDEAIYNTLQGELFVAKEVAKALAMAQKQEAPVNIWQLIDAYADVRSEYQHSTARHLAKTQRENVEFAKDELQKALVFAAAGPDAALVKALEMAEKKFLELEHMLGGGDDEVSVEVEILTIRSALSGAKGN